MAKKMRKSENLIKEQVVLDKVQLFYIKNNLDKSIDELAGDLGLDVSDVESAYNDAKNQSDEDTLTQKFMARNPKAGYVTMTMEAASLEKPKSEKKAVQHIHQIKRKQPKGL